MESRRAISAILRATRLFVRRAGPGLYFNRVPSLPATDDGSAKPLAEDLSTSSGEQDIKGDASAESVATETDVMPGATDATAELRVSTANGELRAAGPDAEPRQSEAEAEACPAEAEACPAEADAEPRPAKADAEPRAGESGRWFRPAGADSLLAGLAGLPGLAEAPVVPAGTEPDAPASDAPALDAPSAPAASAPSLPETGAAPRSTGTTTPPRKANQEAAPRPGTSSPPSRPAPAGSGSRPRGANAPPRPGRPAQQAEGSARNLAPDPKRSAPPPGGSKTQPAATEGGTPDEGGTPNEPEIAAKRLIRRRVVLRASLIGGAGVAALPLLALVGGMARKGEQQPASFTYSMNTNWLFGGQYTSGSESSFYDDGNFAPVALPHTVTGLSWQNWDVSTWQQVWIYRRHFSGAHLLGAHPEGNRIFIDFDGVMVNASVVLNDQVVSTHQGGYLPWSAELTGKVAAGDNLLAVIVDARCLPVPPVGVGRGPDSIDFFQPGGIYRDVNLRVLPQAFLPDLFALPVNVLSPQRRVDVE